MLNLIKKGLPLSLILFFSIISNTSKAQCTTGLTANTTATITVSGTAWQTVNVASGGLEYIDFTATIGNTYAFTFRSNLGGSCSFDEQLSILTTANAASGGVFATSTINASTTAGAEIMYWSPSASGTFRIVISKTGCTSTTAASVLAFTSIPATTNFAIWLGFTSTAWNTTTSTNWARRAAAGYPTSTTVPSNTDDVFMNSGNTVMPDAGDFAVTCRDITVQNGVTLTLQHTAASLAVYGNFTMNGTLNHIGTVYVYFYGSGKTISGTGNFYGGTVCPLRITQGASYTLGTLAGNTLRVSHFYLDWTSGAGGTLSIGANKLSTHFFFQNGTFNQNTGTLEISGPNSVAKAYAPFFNWASVDGTNPYIQGARFNAGTGTTYYNSGDFTNSDNYTLGNQQVSSGTGSAVTYYNLKIRTNNGNTVTIGSGTAFTVSNDLEIYNPGTAGGVATTLSDITLNGNFIFGNAGNALTFNLANRLARSVAGTGIFTMGNNTAHAVNVSYAHATNWAISLGAAGITTPLTFHGTVTYNSGSAQKVMSPNYYNLAISGSGSRTLTASTVISGNLTNSGTLDVTASNYNITLAGNFANSGTFTPQAHTFTFNGAAAQSLTNTSATTGTYTGNITSTVAITDNSPTGGVIAGNSVPTAAALSGKTSLSISVPAPTGSYISLNSITLNTTHTYNSDLDFYLVSPDNTVLVISTDNGGAGDGYLNVTFSDAGATVPPTASTTFNNVTYKPEAQTFASYNGLYTGTWKLYAIDGAAGDIGILTSFSLSLTSQSSPNAAALNLYNLTINNSGNGVITNNDISINSAAVVTLTSGTLDLNTNKLILNNPAASAISAGSNSAYIISETNANVNPSIIQWKMATTTGAHVFPFGVSGSYIPFTFNKTTAGVADISVSTRATVATDNLPLAGISSVGVCNSMTTFAGGSADGSVIDRWWDITVSAAVTGDLIFTYRGIENTTTAGPTGAVGAQHWNGTSWDDAVGTGTGVTSGTGTVAVSGANTFSPWTIVTKTSPLPIELLSFAGKKEGTKNRLDWKTATEINNDYFTIERSTDAKTFEQLIKVDGAGNSLSELNYHTFDNSPFANVTYYRLKQTDYDGKHSYSSVIAIENKSDEILATVYPNPSNDNFNLSFYSPVQGTIKTLIYDHAGRVIISKEESVSKGQSILNTDMNGLSNGLYTMIVSFDGSDNFRSITKIIKN